MKKACTKCGQTQPIFEFYKNARYADGYYSWCKGCFKQAQRNRPAKVKALEQKNWRESNPDKRQAIAKRAYKKRKAETGLTNYGDLEKKKKRMAIYRNEHREELRQKSRKRYHRMMKTKDGKRYWRALVRRRLDGGSLVSAAMIREIEQENEERYGILTCEYCKVPVGDTYHLEHKTPISRGGGGQKINLCIACPVCNLSKGVLTADEFRQRLKVV